MSRYESTRQRVQRRFELWLENFPKGVELTHEEAEKQKAAISFSTAAPPRLVLEIWRQLEKIGKIRED